MLIMVVVLGLTILVGGIAIALGLAPEDEPPVVVAAKPAVEKPSAFFVAPNRDEAAQLEVLLARLEQHVRQERAAVEMFPDNPSVASLRGGTTSPLAN